MKHKCHICNSETYEQNDGKGKIYHFCNSCFFVSLDSAFLLSIEDEKARYNMHNNTLNNEGYKHWLMDFADQAVKPFVSKDKEILDFGSGPEPVFQELLRMEGYSVDIFDKYFFNEPFTGPYEMITSIEVIEHILYPNPIFETIKGVLTPNGFLAIKTAFRPESDSDFFKWWYKEDSTHVSFYSRKTFEYISALFKMQIIYCDDNSIIIFKT